MHDHICTLKVNFRCEKKLKTATIPVVITFDGVGYQPKYSTKSFKKNTFKIMQLPTKSAYLNN